MVCVYDLLCYLEKLPTALCLNSSNWDRTHQVQSTVQIQSYLVLLKLGPIPGSIWLWLSFWEREYNIYQMHNTWLFKRRHQHSLHQHLLPHFSELEKQRSTLTCGPWWWWFSGQRHRLMIERSRIRNPLPLIKKYFNLYYEGKPLHYFYLSSKLIVLQDIFSDFQAQAAYNRVGRLTLWLTSLITSTF